MKLYKIIMIILFSLLILIFNFSKVYGYNPKIRVIYIDAGHGGKDPGAVYGGIMEKKITLEIALLLKEKLESKNYKVLLTRNSDEDLSNKNVNLRKRSDLYNRSKLINESNCDLYVSIHLNAVLSTKWFGPQVFYNNRNKSNEYIAKTLQKSLNYNLNGERKYMKINNQYMYDRITKAGVLIEAGFISNAIERNNLIKKDYQLKIVNAIIDGIEKMYIN